VKRKQKRRVEITEEGAEGVFLSGIPMGFRQIIIKACKEYMKHIISCEKDKKRLILIDKIEDQVDAVRLMNFPAVSIFHNDVPDIRLYHIVFGRKVTIEGSSGDIGILNDLRYGDLVVGEDIKKLQQRIGNHLS